MGLSLALRFEGAIPPEFAMAGLRALPVLLVIRIFAFYHGGLFHGILRYAGMPELRAIVRATTFGTIGLAMCAVFSEWFRVPRSIYFLEWLTALAAAGGMRFVIRSFGDRNAGIARSSDALVPPVVLLGAGNAGELLLRDVLRSGTPTMRIACILDDDVAKVGARIHGVRVEGPIDRSTMERVLETTGAKRAVLAIPGAAGKRTREILSLCRDLGISLQTLPSLQSIADGQVHVSLLRDVAIEDLLRRDAVTLETDEISKFLAGRRILVTGAAGSIGSELVRQIAVFEPALVALVDHNENGLFFLERELRAKFPEMEFRTLLADIRDPQRIARVFEEIAPDVVYHAAAHKHVPLMEANPTEAIRNNVAGTRVVADAAASHGCDAFVLISTDKAVHPTSVMGATKRVAEMYVQSLTGRSQTRFVAVRFGNVLGSAGSVVPIFRAQIESGGPVQVTHPEMRRYFMTIPEASQLVLQAGALGSGGEIFILDMGELVKVVDLARDMITLSGLRPDVDIEIEFIGQRPGEKLYEELMFDEESAAMTRHPKIRVARIAPQNHDEIRAAVDRLDRLASNSGSVETVRSAIGVVVPEATLGVKASRTIPATSEAPENAVPAIAT